LYYLYKQAGNSIINEHLNHGMISTVKVWLYATLESQKHLDNNTDLL
jgi:hypothetical protein